MLPACAKMNYICRQKREESFTVTLNTNKHLKGLSYEIDFENVDEN